LQIFLTLGLTFTVCLYFVHARDRDTSRCRTEVVEPDYL
jgi:hypothetical protein